MKKSLDFQSIIMKLQEFWAERDCLIWQPYYSQVGAGTMNPATFLRVLGPEPWNVAYVEPSIRPDDGRYGDNPNRLHQFYQFQVILKPDPGNPQEVYLDSLQALGIDPKKHDIRFVEDNWQQPAIGAWGLGWEVWLDGQEITQFTYFQQCGGLDLNPVSVELTYGLERIAMTLQGVRHFKDIQWSPERTYGDVNLKGEYEHSTYYFDVANVPDMRTLYEMYEREAERAIKAGLVLPAHDYVLKTSHAFNILDTRGAVGVTERQALFGRTRDLARRVAQTYVDQRQQAEFPWLVESKPRITQKLKTESREIHLDIAPFLLEIGTEELPPSDLDNALTQLERGVPELLKGLRLSHGEVKVWGTPRRQIVFVEGLATRQPDLTMDVKGPPAERAFDPEGNPTRAAEGFARSKGIEVSDLKTASIDGGEYIVATVSKTGRSSIEVLGEALPGIIADIRFRKSMRWNDSGVAFSRPIRWLLALHDEAVVPFEYAGYTSNRITRGLRFTDDESFDVDSPQDYMNKISAQGILLDPSNRQAEIKKQVDAIAREVGGHVPDDQAILTEVTHLVEKPTAFLGTYNKAYLDQLPPEVLVSVMKKHQRYFVVEDEQGQLMPFFIGVRNGGDEHLDIVVDGNEQVILARFDDAAFFIEKDLQKPLEDFVPDLSTLTFQTKLGSFLEKTNRIEQLVKPIATRMNLSGDETKTAERAAHLCKADLATNMVVEMTSLQGIMGRHYARHSGEEEAVSNAIFEHYLPRFAGDECPGTKPGLVLSLADRLDSLMGLFAAGLAPTGTKDPFAQRRAALGLCQNLIDWETHFDLKWGLAETASVYNMGIEQKEIEACFDFIKVRLRGMLLESGFRYDVVDAVLAYQAHDPYGTLLNVNALTEWVARKDWRDLLPTYSRCVRITRDQAEQYEVDEHLLTLEPEQSLYKSLTKAESDVGGRKTVDDMLKAFLPMVPVVNRFFDEVLVMVEEDATRENRLALLQRIANLTEGIMDMSYLEGF